MSLDSSKSNGNQPRGPKALTETILKDEYAERRLSMATIASKYGTTASTVQLKLEKFGIPARSYSESRTKQAVADVTRENLTELYVNQLLSAKQIAKLLGIGKTTINALLEKFQIPIRTKTASIRIRVGLSESVDVSEETLRRLYVTERRSFGYIRKALTISQKTLTKKIEEYKIPKRAHSDACIAANGNKEFHAASKETLSDLYVSKQMPGEAIATIYDVASGTVWNRLKALGIPRRNDSEARLAYWIRKGKLRPSKDELLKLHDEQNLSRHRMAKILGLSSTTITRMFDQLSISKRTLSEQRAIRNPNLLKITSDVLVHEYLILAKSPAVIGENLGVSSGTITNRLRSFGLTVRSASEAHSLRFPKGKINAIHPALKELNKEFWESAYIQEEQPANLIAQLLGVSESTVLRHLKFHSITIRGPSESHGGDGSSTVNPRYASPIFFTSTGRVGEVSVADESAILPSLEAENNEDLENLRFALDKLRDKSQLQFFIISRIYGFDGSLGSREDLGAQLGLSSEALEAEASQALDHMRRYLDCNDSRK